jgi:hypothetical protein
MLLAVGLSAWVGFTWWALGLVIALALGTGYALRLGDNILEVPISAMLILSVGTRTAADGRIVETLVGARAGLLDDMARGLDEDRLGDAASWLRQARALGGETRSVDEAIYQAEESLRLNPRGLRLPDSTQLTGSDGPLTDPEVRQNLARLLADLAAAVRTYGQLMVQQRPGRRPSRFRCRPPPRMPLRRTAPDRLVRPRF